MVLPLNNILVLEISRVLAGPYCGMLLADMGADVIKVERPGIGDEARFIGPFINNEESAYFASVNRNKKSLVLDLKEIRGQKILKDLAQKADVIVENNRPNALAKLGLGYSEMKIINPRIIYASITGYGHSGPYKNYPSYDIIAQGLGGIMSITGQPGGPPTRVGTSIGDIAAGLFGALGIVSALEARNNTGEGQHIDISMLDCQIALLENAIARFYATETPPQPIGNRHPSVSPFSSLSTSNGHVIVAAGHDNLWEKLCELLEKKELSNDPRFITNQKRTENWEELKFILEKSFKHKTTEEWIYILHKGEIPCAPVNSIDKVVKDPQVCSRNIITEIDHPKAGKLNMVNIPIKFSATPCQEIRMPSPSLGQHTEDILTGYLKYTKEHINTLNKEGVTQ